MFVKEIGDTQKILYGDMSNLTGNRLVFIKIQKIQKGREIYLFEF